MNRSDRVLVLWLAVLVAVLVGELALERLEHSRRGGRRAEYSHPLPR